MHPNIGAPQYIRQTLTDIKGEIDSNTIIVGDFNTPLTGTLLKTKATTAQNSLDHRCNQAGGWYQPICVAT